MIENFSVTNLANIKSLKVNNLSNINVFTGKNDTGKTMILNILYVLSKSLENFNRGDENKTFKEIISEKLYWVFQVNKLGDLVSKDREDKSKHFEIKATIDNQNLFITFGDSANKTVGNITEIVENRQKNSIFIPAKEVLSLFSVIKKSRFIDKTFGFDDTYLDLVIALEQEPKENFVNFIETKKILNNLINGKFLYENGAWFFRRDRMKISIFSTAEGIKKIGIIDRLLANGYIQPDSIMFIDEPESFLHPRAVVDFLDIIALLAQNKIQIFIATHSYFVINKLMLVAKKDNVDIPIISLAKDNYTIDNLKDGLPQNSILDTLVTLYEDELDLAL